MEEINTSSFHFRSFDEHVADAIKSHDEMMTLHYTARDRRSVQPELADDGFYPHDWHRWPERNLDYQRRLEKLRSRKREFAIPSGNARIYADLFRDLRFKMTKEKETMQANLHENGSVLLDTQAILHENGSVVDTQANLPENERGRDMQANLHVNERGRDMLANLHENDRVEDTSKSA